MSRVDSSIKYNEVYAIPGVSGGDVQDEEAVDDALSRQGDIGSE